MTKARRLKVIASFGAALLAAGLTTGATSAPPSGGEELTADRVIYKLDQQAPALPKDEHEHLFADSPDASGWVNRGPAPAIPADERPGEGEVVKVLYSDAVVTHQLSRGCSISATAGTPYVQSGWARAGVTYSHSGCSIDRAGAKMYMWWGLYWHLKDQEAWTPYDGSYYSLSLAWRCNNSNNSTFYSEVYNRYAGEGGGGTVIASSGKKSLACGV